MSHLRLKRKRTKSTKKRTTVIYDFSGCLKGKNVIDVSKNNNSNKVVKKETKSIHKFKLLPVEPEIECINHD